MKYKNRQNKLLSAKRNISLILGLVFIVLTLLKGPAIAETKTEILWDTWGVPHIYAKDEADLFRAFGWAQAHSHGNAILKLYGQARGRAAEYWGINELPSDQMIQMMGIPERATSWYQAQSYQMRRNLDAFAEGINTYAQKQPQAIDEPLKVVLPITGVDVLAHVQRILYFEFVTNPQAWGGATSNSSNLGSNAWAIAPSKSTSGKAMLLANPHLPWSDKFRFYEAHLNGPGVNLYGVALVGMPMLAIAFNDHLGWTLTINHPHNANLYELTLKDQGYVWDGGVKPFTTQTKQLKIKQRDGSYQTLEWDIKSSQQGVVVSQQSDRAYALRVAGLDRPQLLEQFWQMGQAKNLSAFEKAWQKLQIPLFNVLYADQQGEIFYLYNAIAPKRSGDWTFWDGVVPGNTSKTLWKDYLSYDKLPKLKNPKTGWLQNTNDPPWTSTFPSQLNPKNYPADLAAPSLADAPNLFRTQRSIKLLQGNKKLSLEEVIQAKFSSHLEMADRVLELLLPAAKLLANPIGLEAAEVLRKWDRQTNADSRGAVLFMLWASTLGQNRIFSKPWQADNPLNTPGGLENINTSLAVLEGVAAQMQYLYGSLDIPWGEVVKLNVGNYQLPASGGPGELGSFRVLDLRSRSEKQFQAVFGDSFIAAIAFSQPLQAKVLTVYGNATQPNSPHVGDQLPLYAKNQLRTAWRDRQEIEQHLELREDID
ncbi:MAG: acylase [Snowella sp.]|nr:acylase [Snowella sp.]